MDVEGQVHTVDLDDEDHDDHGTDSDWESDDDEDVTVEREDWMYGRRGQSARIEYFYGSSSDLNNAPDIGKVPEDDTQGVDDPADNGKRAPGMFPSNPGSTPAPHASHGMRAGLESNAPITPNMVIVDRTGVHSLRVEFCRCLNHPNDIDQLLDMGLYPASQQRFKTCFTFDVLDDFVLDNLECKTSASNFYTRLRRVTDPVFPDRVPVGLNRLHCIPQLTRNPEQVHGAPSGDPAMVPLDGSQEAGVRVSRTNATR